jgi:SAM-dependent methyltransferase
MSETISLLCPSCGSGIVTDAGAISCKGCTKDIKMIDGVMDLGGGQNYWEMIPKEQMGVFLRNVKDLGWAAAIRTSEVQKIRDLYLWADAPSRTDASYFLPLTRESTVLDLGSGWGSYTFPLSLRTKLVVAADSCMESLKFISLRARQDRAANIFPVHIRPLDSGRLPFAPGQFDCVIMNGVLEWVGSYVRTGDPKKIQERCLKDICRILKPGGAIYIGIENRYGFQYFLGAPDDHLMHYSPDVRVAYTTLMPRFAADMVTRRRLNVPYRTFTHSIRTLKAMLKNSGFGRSEFYYPEKGYRALSTKVSPVESGETESLMRKKYGARPLFRALSGIFGARSLCDSYFAVAYREKI